SPAATWPTTLRSNTSFGLSLSSFQPARSCAVSPRFWMAIFRGWPSQSKFVTRTLEAAPALVTSAKADAAASPANTMNLNMHASSGRPFQPPWPSRRTILAKQPGHPAYVSGYVDDSVGRVGGEVLPVGGRWDLGCKVAGHSSDIADDVDVA